MGSHHFSLFPHMLAPAAEPVEKDPREGGPFSAKGLHLNTKTKAHPKARNLQCWMFKSKPLVISEHYPNLLAERQPKTITWGCRII